MLADYQCAECGKTFRRQKRNVRPPKFCGQRCAARYNLKRANSTNEALPPRQCKGCGEEFKPIHLAHYYCSAKCRVLDIPKKEVSKYDCAICGKIFSDPRYRRRVCGDHCRVLLMNWDTDSRPEKVKPTQVCEACGKTFVSPKKRSRFCSMNCRYSSPKFKENAKEPQVTLDVYTGWGDLDFDGLCPFDPQIYPFKNVEMRA